MPAPGRARAALFALAAALALPVSTGAQSASAPAFSGRYRLVVTAAPGCPAAIKVGPLTVAVEVRQSPVAAGAEVSGESAAAGETPDNGRFVWLRQGDRLHGAFAASTQELGLRTLEGTYRLWVQLMADGTAATASGGRARASGTAFGFLEISLSSDPTGAPVGTCPFALDHQWSLEPI